MSIEQIGDLVRQTLGLALLLSAPLLAVALGAGLVVSVFQAATQVNEQTLTFVPKIVLVLGTFAVLFPWIMREVVDFGTKIFLAAAQRGAP